MKDRMFRKSLSRNPINVKLPDVPRNQRRERTTGDRVRVDRGVESVSFESFLRDVEFDDRHHLRIVAILHPRRIRRPILTLRKTFRAFADADGTEDGGVVEGRDGGHAVGYYGGADVEGFAGVAVFEVDKSAVALTG